MKPQMTFAVFILPLAAAPASAQTYVSAGLTGDIVRVSHTESPTFDGEFGSGEALGFALRVGTSITDRWGVELEFARPSEIEVDGTPGAMPLGSSSFVWSSSESVPPGPNTPGFTIITPDQLPVPFAFSLRSAHRNTTVGTTAWVKQQLWDRASMVYLGGVAFHRAETEIEYSFNLRPIPGIPPPRILPPPFSSETITYSVRPVVGVEARIEMTDHLQIVPGMRLHGLQSGVLVRPSVALGWQF